MSPADRDAIAAVLVRYAESWDGRQVEAWLALFADDCVFARSGAVPVRGKTALRTTFTPLLQELRTSGRTTRHDVSEVTVEADGTQAAKAAAAVTFTGDTDEAEAPPVVVHGRYDARLIRDAGRWLIAEWRYTRLPG